MLSSCSPNQLTVAMPIKGFELLSYRFQACQPTAQNTQVFPICWSVGRRLDHCCNQPPFTPKSSLFIIRSPISFLTYINFPTRLSKCVLTCWNVCEGGVCIRYPAQPLGQSQGAVLPPLPPSSPWLSCPCDHVVLALTAPCGSSAHPHCCWRSDPKWTPWSSHHLCRIWASGPARQQVKKTSFQVSHTEVTIRNTDYKSVKQMSLQQAWLQVSDTDVTIAGDQKSVTDTSLQQTRLKGSKTTTSR